MANEAHFSVVGFVATLPKSGVTKAGTPTLSMRVGWTPRILDRNTGEWADQPSSFITVQCYRKVAEHGYICLRRGDPVVVRGTLRVREYVDQNGVRRSSVEVHADSIGHDLSRGITMFRKTQAQVEQSAFEHEQAMAAAEGRNPLLGDRAAAEPDGAHDDRDAEARYATEAATDDAPEAEPGDTPDSEFGSRESFDEDDATGIEAGLEEAREPVGALA